VAVSEAERDQALAVGLPAKMIAVVRNGIAMTVPQVSAARWEDERIKVLFVGRLDRQKGFDTLADIARRQGKTVAVRVIGASVTNGQESAAELDNVEHFGWLRRSEIIRHLHACDVVAMPSRWEGLPISALEAMRSAKPVIAFAVGGLAEVIEDRVTGRLIPPGDARAFEQALITTPPAVLREWGCAGRQRFERLFTSTRMARELFDIYATGNKDV
jgi:glycosyltransferase involved in cell wall biosynthesis